MAKVVETVKEEGVSFGKVLVGTGAVAVGAVIGDFIGALAGGYIARKFIKSKQEQEVIKIISYLVAADLFLEKFIKPRGLI